MENTLAVACMELLDCCHESRQSFNWKFATTKDFGELVEEHRNGNMVLWLD